MNSDQFRTDRPPMPARAAPSAARADRNSGDRRTPLLLRDGRTRFFATSIAPLQRLAGNASVSRLLKKPVQRQESGGMSTASGTSAPGTPSATASTPTESQMEAKAAADDAVKDFTQGKFRNIKNWSGVAESVRIQLLEKATDTGLFWVDPNDEAAIERCWSSFGENFTSTVRANAVLWNRSIDRGADPERIPQSQGVFDAFKKDVDAAAEKNLDANADRVVQEFFNFGIEPPWDQVRPSQPDRNKVGSDRGTPTVGGPTTTDMLAEQSRVAKALLKYDIMLSNLEKSLVGLGLTFQPATPPAPGRAFELGNGKTMWDVTNEQWVKVAAEVALITNAWPVLYSARMTGTLSSFADQTYDKPDPSKPFDPNQEEQKRPGLDAVRTQLGGVLAAIKKTRDADIDPLDMVPIHNAFFLGRMAPASGRSFVREVLTGILDDERKSRDFNAAIVRLGIDIALAVAMVTGIVGTMGGAAIAVGVAAASAAKADTRADKLGTALGTSVSDAGALVSKSTVTAADAEAQQAKIELAQAVIMSVLDVGSTAVSEALSPASQQKARDLMSKVETPTSGSAADIARGQLRSAAGVAGSTTGGAMKPWGVAENLRPTIFKDPVNVRLKGDGIPEIKTVRLNKDVRAMQFVNEDWAIEMNPRFVQGDAISQSQFDSMVEGMYHEARHAEQDFHVARWRKMKMAGGAKLQEEYQFKIPADVDAAATPMKPGDPLEAKAAAWWESQYGTKAIKRGYVYDRLDDATADLAAKTAKLEGASKSIPATERARLERELAQAQKEFREADQAYRQLPEEVDAYKVGGERGAWAAKGLRVNAAQAKLDSANVRVAVHAEEVSLYESRGVSGTGLDEARDALGQAQFDVRAASDELAKAKAMP